MSAEKLNESEIHELALVYAHAKVLSFMQCKQSYDDGDVLNLLIKSYKTAIKQIPIEEVREIS